MKLEYENQSKGLHIKHEWVCSHQDKDHSWDDENDLQELDIPILAKFNTICDKNATNAIRNLSDLERAVFPMEEWAIYSTIPITRKFTGKLNNNILYTLYQEDLMHYIHQKHVLCSAKL